MAPKREYSLEPMLKPSEVAAHLNVSRTHVYTLIHRNELEAVNVGRSIRIPKQSVERFCEANAHG